MKRPPPIRNLTFHRPANASPTRRVFERFFQSSRALNSFITESGKIVLTCMIWPRFVAPYRWRLTRYPLPLVGLDPALAGQTILQLTDLHVGKTRLSYLERAFDACMREKPDLVVLTGDLIDYHPHSLEPLTQLLRRLTNNAHQPRHGFAAIFGNHDYHEYSWRHVGPRSAQRAVHKRLVHIVEASGIRLLRNEKITISSPGIAIPGPAPATTGNTKPLTIVGLDEMWTGRANAAQAFQGLTPRDPVLCLQHNPDGVEFLKPFPWQFMLCGHSHGGQANFPFLGALYVPMEHRHYLRGFFHFPPLPGQPIEHRSMFVSTGLGHSTPIRLNCPPEATLFTLTEPAAKHAAPSGA